MPRVRSVLFLLAGSVALGIGLGIAERVEAKKKKPKQALLYVHDDSSTTNRVFAYVVDNKGQMTPVAGSPFAVNDGNTGCAGDCGSLAYSSRLRLLFVAGEGGVTVFNVAADGVLTEVVGSPFGGFEALAVTAIDRNGDVFVYATDNDQAEVHAFEASETGTLAPVPGSPFPTGPGPIGLAGNTERLVVANSDAQTATPYTIGNDGSLTVVGGGAAAIPGCFFVDVDGDFVYAVNGGGQSVFGFELNGAGQLITIPGSPFPVGLGGTAGLAHSKGNKMVVVSPVAGLNARVVTQKGTGVLTPKGDLIPLGSSGQNTCALDPTGKLLAVAGGARVAVFTLSSKGKLALADQEAVAFETAHATGSVFAPL